MLTVPSLSLLNWSITLRAHQLALSVHLSVIKNEISSNFNGINNKQQLCVLEVKAFLFAGIFSYFPVISILRSTFS